MAVAEYDVFLSHTWNDRDLDSSRQIYNVLTEAGLRVCMDAEDFEDFQSITQAVTEGLTKSKALLAYYSKIYPTRRACQWELTTAFLAGQSRGDPRLRVLVINPEDSSDHIHPVELRDAKYIAAPKNGAEMPALADAVRQHVDKLEGSLPDVQPLKLPEWYGTSPDRYPRFVGRFAEMWQVHSALHESDVAVINGAAGKDIAQVAGLGGIGKSLLAREYALRFGSAYPGGVFWLNAYGNDSTKATLSAVERDAEQRNQLAAFVADIKAPAFGDTIQQIRSALKVAIQRDKKPCLWIVDDLPSGLSAEQFASWCAPHPLARTLITTRARIYDELGSTKSLISLDVLPEDDAYQLLKSHRVPEGQAEEAEARVLVRDLGCHALAVEVTGARLKSERGLRSFREFRQELARQDEDVLEFANLSQELPLNHEKSIVTTLIQSIERVGPQGRDFLRLASVLAVAPIPPKLVSDVFQRADGLNAQEAINAADQAISQAENLSLCQRGEGTGGACTVHTLVSRVVRFHENSLNRTVMLREAAVEALRAAIASVIKDHQIRGESELHAAHARLLVARVANLNEADLLDWLARYDLSRGSYSSARMLYERESEFRVRAQGEEHPDALTARNGLAETLYAQGDLRAAQRHGEQVLEAFRRLLGEEHPATLKARNNLAGTLQARGDLAEARQHQQQVLAARRRLLGEEHPDTLTARNNLAQTLAEQGDLAGAQQHQEQVLAAFRRLLGEEHPDTLTARNNLAQTLAVQGDLVGAREEEEQVLAARRRLIGEEHPETLMTRLNLASTLKAEGDLAGARQQQEQVLAASRRLLGEEHPFTLRVRHNLADTMNAQGDLAGARQQQEQVLAASRRLLGEEHPDTLGARNNLACTLWAQGDLAEARQHQQQVLEARRRLLGEEHSDTSKAARNLFHMLQYLGEHVAARSVLKRDLAWLLGRDPSTLGADQQKIREYVSDVVQRMGKATGG